MNHFERIKAALGFKPVDRIPVNLWAHLPQYDQNPKLLARKQVEYAKQFDFDFIKLMPFGLYGVEDYGAEITYFTRRDHPAVLARPGIQTYSDWNQVEPLAGTYGTYGKQVELAKYAREFAKNEFPIVQTIFNPLTTALKLAGNRLVLDIKEHPDAVKQALEALVQTTINFVNENINAGVDGFFYATQTATSNLFTREEYLEFGRPYDLKVLDAFKDKTWFNIAHIHGNNTYFDIIADYPVQALNWHDRSVSPSLSEARQLTNKALIGGLHELPYPDGKPSLLITGNVNDVENHVREAIDEVNGTGLIIGPGCVAGQKIPEANIYALRSAVGLNSAGATA
ncbi:uroporphyrinogen decarboxylase family protein [Secundilactobacillus folii]|uniref:Uroporphyrinogen decarboxylase n=1 Tax=Secundilactobacillus folii TaxID=2678357 RepID=A0A7X3C1E2_9LACO|nr:uroporphyrinogen decarboxylase family protein [Secundilactobacillus folii]MTV81630.1 uroporphyrinogen decarboxylase [Secundilactobacillus folii]